MNLFPATLTSARPSGENHRALALLLAHEWSANRRIFGLLGVAWFCGLWILVLFNHPAWLLVPAGFCVIMATPARAGADVLDGTEEFSFSLPPGRGPLFLARVLPGLGFILATGITGGLAIALDLPQALWSLVFSGPLTEPFARVEDREWYFLAVLYPLAAHAWTAVLAAMTTSRSMVMLAWFWGASAAALAGSIAAMVEQLVWNDTNGLLAIPVLLALTVGVLLAGHRAYLGKEATRSAGTPTSGLPKLILILLIIGIVFLLLSFFMLRPTHVSNRSTAEERAQEAQRKAETLRVIHQREEP